ncbi:MAG TPA: hypothetical protein VMU24_00865 [Candidatus Acidoferrales bacterium]|nr:hypothetical protein [Candidatus Acidoferrales bacterium]
MNSKCMLAVIVLALPAWGQVNTSPATVNRVREMLNGAAAQPTASSPTKTTAAPTNTTMPAAKAPAAQPKAAAPARTREIKPAVVNSKKQIRRVHRAALTTPKRPVKPEAPKPEAVPALEMKDGHPTINLAGKKRDPFISPIVEKLSKVPCTAGKKCLPVSEAVLKGVIHTVQGDVAVVVNPENKAYFLRVNDPVFDGVVLSISQNSIVFRESYSDALGRPLTREVVKKIQGPA